MSCKSSERPESSLGTLTSRWSTPISLGGIYGDGFEPAVAVDQTDGVVSVAWYDRRDDPANKLYRLYYAQSTDGGATFSGPIAVSDAQSDPTLNCLGTGGYMQMVATDGFAHPFWIDTRNGHNQVFTAAVDEAAVAESVAIPGPLFGPASTAIIGGNQHRRALAMGDFNRDGNMNVAIASTAPTGFAPQHGNVSVLLGNGHGVFQAPVTYDLTGCCGSVDEVVAADFNGDGNLDLAVGGSSCAATCTSYVWILKGDGQGGFTVEPPIPAAASGIAVGDLNGDGKPDLVLGGTGQPLGSLKVMLNTSTGGAISFGAPKLIGVNGDEPVVADFNRDGKADIPFLNEQAQQFGVTLGNGDGTFKTPVIYSLGSGGGIPNALITGDLNGDGIPDLIEGGSNGLDILLGNGDGTFRLSHVPYFAFGDFIEPMALGDFNGDGVPDLLIGGPGLPGADLLPGNGDGTFQRPTVITYAINPDSAVVADLNLDGLPDIFFEGADPNTNENAYGTLLASGLRLAVSSATLQMTSPGYGAYGPAQPLTISNPGTTAKTIALVRATSSDFSKTDDGCSGVTLQPGTSCQVMLIFDPRVAPIENASLAIVSNAPDTLETAGLVGQRVRAAAAGRPAATPPRSRSGPPPPPKPRTPLPHGILLAPSSAQRAMTRTLADVRRSLLQFLS